MSLGSTDVVIYVVMIQIVAVDKKPAARSSAKSPPASITVVPSTRHNDADKNAVTGTYKCTSSGVLTLLFDNTYSKLRSKQVFYKLDLSNAGHQHIPFGITKLTVHITHTHIYTDANAYTHT